MNHQDRSAQRSQQPADRAFSIFEDQVAAQAACSTTASLHPKGRALNLHRTRRLALTASARARQAWAIARKRRPKLRALARAAAPGQPVSLRSFRLGALLACAVWSAALHSAWAAPVVIQNPYLRVGISEIGTLGINGSASPGVEYDPTGSSNFGGNDVLGPITPTEGFLITTARPGSCSIPLPLSSAASHCQYSFTETVPVSSFVAPTAPVLTGASSATWSGVSLDGSMGIDHRYSVWTAGPMSVIGVTTTVTALQGALDDVRFVRFMDPDPDGVLSVGYGTNNTIVSNSRACASGTNSGQTVCINSSSPVTHQVAISPAYSFTLDPILFLYFNPAYNAGFGDHGVGEGFDLGTIQPGQSKTIQYEYLLGTSLKNMTGPVPPDTAIPEPGSVGLVGLALSVLGLMRRKNPDVMKPA